MKYDLDLQRTVYGANVHDKTFFITKEDETKGNIKYIEKYGKVCPLGIQNFSQMVKEIRENYHPITHIPPHILCFDNIVVPKVAKNILDKDIFDLFYGGTLQTEKLYYSLLSPEDYPYSVYRTKLSDTLENIEEGNRLILVHSELGNGKTVFIQSLETLLVQKGYKIFHFRKYRSTISRELEYICKNHNQTVIVFDDYVGNIEILKELSIIYTDQILIVSERTATNEANYHLLNDCFGDFYHIDINLLNNQEVDDLIHLFDHYGLWHEMAAKPQKVKVDFIQKKCNLKFGNVILMLLESPNILNKYQSIIDKIKSKSVYYDAILFILIAHISKLNLDLDDVSNALGTTNLNTPSFKRDPIVNEFIDFDKDEIKQKSSIVSEFILRKIIDSTTVVEVILKIFKRLATQSNDKATRQILRKMMTFTNVQHVLNRKDPDYASNLLYLYDTIGKLDFCRKNPHYWLQYAIVMLSQYKYAQANAYFNNAYAYAHEIPDFDTYQIDNHHARFILENEREYGTNETCMKAFLQAHNILIDPKHKRDVRHYPYRVAQNYYPFYEKFYKGMSSEEKNVFLNACREMLDRITNYESTATDVSRDVRKAKEMLFLIQDETS